MSDLRDRVPGHSLVERLLQEFDAGRIRDEGGHVVVDDEVRSWYRGVHGERAVASELSRLGAGWLVLHSVPVGAGDTDIDHVVIGPGGVFTINAKYSPGKKVWAKGYGLFVDGHRTSYVPKAIKEAQRASNLLSRASGLTVPVTAIIAFVDPGPMTAAGRVGGDDYEPTVRVMRHRDLYNFLGGAPNFSAEQVQRMMDAATRPTTWHSNPKPAATHSIAREFEALEAAVGPALAAPITAGTRHSPASSRPPSRRSGTGRKRRRKINWFGEVIFPFSMLAGGWVYFTYFFGK
jgi:hypothetical protein